MNPPMRTQRPLLLAHLLLALLLLLVCALTTGCETKWRIGDKVWVEWDSERYPAYIISVEALKYRVHYDGYDSVWDETILPARIKGRVEGLIARVPPPPPKVRARMPAVASGSTSGSASGAIAAFKTGEKVKVLWKDVPYPATLLSVGPEKARVHYDGYSASWDEDVDLKRIRSARP